MKTTIITILLSRAGILVTLAAGATAAILAASAAKAGLELSEEQAASLTAALTGFFA